MHTVIEHADSQALALACGQQLIEAVAQAQAQGRSALLALAGGRTAPPILRLLCAGWPDAAVARVIPTDERWVPMGHPDHNFGQLASGLAAAPHARVHSLTPEVRAPWPSQPQLQTAADLLAPLHRLQFDAVLLGMGPDGHFASLFPGAPNLAQAMALGADADVYAIQPDPLPVAGPWPRVSLGLARLLRSRRLLLAITGLDKRAVLERAWDGDPDLPVSALLAQQHTAVQIHWSP